MLQALPSLRNEPEDSQQELEDAYLKVQVTGQAGDVAESGEPATCKSERWWPAALLTPKRDGCRQYGVPVGFIFNTTWRRPNLWSEPFQSCTALELQLPDDGPGMEPSFQEVELADGTVIPAMQH